MNAMASQITNVSIVYSTVCSSADKKKTWKLRVTGLCEGNSPVTGEFPAQGGSDAKNVSILWRLHAGVWLIINLDYGLAPNKQQAIILSKPVITQPSDAFMQHLGEINYVPPYRENYSDCIEDVWSSWLAPDLHFVFTTCCLS